MKDYKSTLHMPKTDFPMRGRLGKNEPKRQAFWEEEDIYRRRLEKNRDNPPFVLPDGPPYANGDIHIGHALNKILKDMIVRDKSMRGFHTRFVPGWDTHGLPIETALTRDEGVDRKTLSIPEFRRRCADFARTQIDNQRRQFKRLGILGEWEEPYVTMDRGFEASQLETFADMVEQGLIYKGLKPVFWSPSSETALAEAEIEYAEKTSPSIYFTFEAVETGSFDEQFKFLVWTTTPWTIPANLALAVSEEIDYVFVRAGEEIYVLAEALLSDLKERLGLESVEVLRHVKGEALLGLTYRHPLYDRESPVVRGHHVTIESGTGLVHIAPGHGEDDFLIGRNEGLETFCPVDERGRMTAESGAYEGLFVEDCSERVVEDLKAQGSLLKLERMTHSYPHDWRTKQPVIFRATDQWFASVETLKDQLVEAVNGVEWQPAWGRVRMENMIKDRTSWCISRQRAWGVPIPVFYREDDEPILDADVIRHVASIFRSHGSNAWYELDAEALLPEGYKTPGEDIRKETDTMDVWFDSGTVHRGGQTDRGMDFPADLYLEGSDQYRGWFNSSLTTAVASRGEAPYRTVLTHGFVLDGEGRKMSKSLGNVVDPIEEMEQKGADILRLWVANVEYTGDVRISEKMMRQIAESYRKIRNTLRFMLGVLADFDPARDAVQEEALGEVERYMLLKLDRLVNQANGAYVRYAFDDVMRHYNRFVVRDLSAFYLDVIKDTVYIETADDPARRGVQTVVHRILLTMLKQLTPILPHTMEEAYQYLPGAEETSVYLEDMPEPQSEKDPALFEKYEAFMTLREDVLKALEEARNEKTIGKSLEAKLTLHPKDGATRELLSSIENLEKLFIVSRVEFAEDQGRFDGERLSIDVEAAEGERCARCWQVDELVEGKDVCERCDDVLSRMGLD